MNYKKLSVLLLFFITQIIYAQFGNKQEIAKIKLYGNQDKVHPGTIFKAAIIVNIQNGWHINSDKPNDEFLIPSKVVSQDVKLPLAKIQFPKPKEINLGFSDKPVSVFEGEFTVGLLINIDKDLPIGEYKIPVQLKYQACNDQTCMPPGSVADTLTLFIVDEKISTQAINDDIFSKLDFSSTNPSVKKNEDNSIASTLESSGIILSLLFIFIGGLALNLTPCVYPLIPITIGYFGGQSEGKTSRLFLLGILYVLGMALTYSIIGVVTALSGSVFGTLMQNTFVLIGIALLFVILALSQFGVYEFQLPNSWVEKAGGAKGGAFGAFFMGLTMGIVAAPCIGPFVLGLVTYVAAKGDPFNGFLMFFVLALGLGLPYLLLALFSGKIKNLPRAGSWMEGVKHIFGFLLLGMALYFVDPIMPKSFQPYILPVFGIITALILLLVDKVANNIKGFKIFKIVFAFIVLAFSVYALIPSERISPEWQKFSNEKYEASLRNNERIVIDFYADWCIPCKELDAITFADKNVVAEIKRFSTYKVDMTQTLSEEAEIIRNKFNIVGMPTVLIINSKGDEVERLTGFVNAKDFLQLLKETD